ncbi:MAG TPA: DUF3179 domain-containing protein [bacterium]|nr:DUF3179 domain-containing protein [bacterium]
MTFLTKYKKTLIYFLLSLIPISLGIAVYLLYPMFVKKPAPIEELVVQPVLELEEPEVAEVMNAPETEFLSQYSDKGLDYDLTEIDGTPNKNMFADITSPKFLDVSAETKLEDTELVASFHIKDDYRAYPISYMYYHHLVNDTFGNQPVLISFCGICNSAIAFNPVVNDQSLSFGVLGVLYHNDLVMYDRETDSWWVQVTGDGISGNHKGTSLEIIPGMEIVEYSDFKSGHPDGKVLQPVPGYTSQYQQFDYFDIAEERTRSGRSGAAADYNQVLGVQVRGVAKAYIFDDIEDTKVINDTLNGWSLLILKDPDDGGVRIFRRLLDDRVLDFEVVNSELKDIQTGSIWNFQGSVISGELEGESLLQPDYLELYKFAWEGFYPDTTYYTP